MPAYQNILVCLDLADGSDRLLSVAQGLAQKPPASILALHVVEFVPTEPLGESVLPTMRMEQELAQQARERLQSLIARQRPGGAASRARVEIGSTKAEILRAAGEVHADLIVIGSRERHGLAILVNFTEDAVLHAAPCDVLAVRLH